MGASVLDAADLRANDRVALSGALALVPGVTFTRIGSRNETTVYMRGYDLIQRFYLRPNTYQLRNVGQARYAGVELDAR